jgi:hypothetical protein
VVSRESASSRLAICEPNHGESRLCRSIACLDEERWQILNALADAADEAGTFAALAGFEWSSPFLGHVNVWFSERWIDPLHTAALGASGWGEHFHEAPVVGPMLGPVMEEALRQNPARTGMAPFYTWFRQAPDTPGIGGGLDGLACFNHPGRETGRFDHFAFFPEVRDQFVALEILNRREDHLFRSFERGQPSPLVECLNAGWRVGLLGVADEHAHDWRAPRHLGKGRAGLWVTELSRAGVRAALEARRFFATFHAGLRLDATLASRAGQGGLNGIQMGGEISHRAGPATFTVDLDREGWAGKPVQIQVLRPADRFPDVVHLEDAVVPAPGDDPSSFTVPLDRADGDWVVLRIADPTEPNYYPGPEGHPSNNAAIAYASPWWLVG